MLSAPEAVHLEPARLEVVFGRAFLVALARQDRHQAMVFARALLTQFPKVRRHPR